MLLRQPVHLLFLLLVLSIVAITPGCIIPKKYQPGKPFVFSTNIDLDGNLQPSEKIDLKTKLANQLDDSLKTRIITKYPGRKILDKPPVFDSAYAARSVLFMNNLLQSLGYYKAAIEWDTSITVRKHQQRVTVDFTVTPGKSYKFDSIAYRLEDSALQLLAMSRRNGSLIKKGEPYSIEIISAELDRLVELFRNNGYYKFSRDDLNAQRDTVFAALIDPSLDPFERLSLLQEAKRRQENPTMNLVIHLRNPAAVNHFRKYYLRNVNVYPDLDYFEDTLGIAKYDTVKVKGLSIFNKYNKFKPAFIASRSLLRPGEMYRLRNQNRTYSNFAELNTFIQVSVDLQESKDSTPALDAFIRMYPSKKQDLSVSVDASYNTGDLITTGNLFGVGLNLGLNNRNVARQAIQSSTNLRTGVEIDLGKNFLQTVQTSLSHTISFPRFIFFPFKIKHPDSLRFARTLLNFNGAYTDRRNFYELRSLNASFGWQWARKRHTWYWSPLNVEYVKLNPRQQLEDLLASVPNLQFSFNNGLIISQVFGYNYVQGGRNGAKKNDIRVGLEESGGLFGLLKGLDKNSNLYRFVKLELEYKHYINYKKSALVFRTYGCIGVPYGKNSDGTSESQLPFFKSFYAGGPYSMRAWQVRQLGIGSSRYFDTSSSAKGVDRFGDIQLEGNVEYRFNLGTLFGVLKLKSALFTDIGNIWYRNTQNNIDYKNADFRLSKLYRDLAVGAGTSLRLDFDYFLIRFDWAYKLKNPAYADINDGWWHDLQLLKGQFQLGINYPF